MARWVLHAALDGNVAIDGIGEHSLFTTALLKHMNEDLFFSLADSSAR